MKMMVLDCTSSPLDFLSVMLDDHAHGRKAHGERKATRGAALSIINECSTECGENVGGSSTTTAAPEVAASGDEGDGDGDPDPERRRRSRRQSNARNALPPAVEHLDRLPESAILDIAALKFITGKSRATIYRWIEKGLLPKPRRLGASSNNVWAAGEIRRALSA